MKTDALIQSLTEAAGPVDRGVVARRVLVGAGLGALAALVLVLTVLKLRPDLAQAVRGPIFWSKLGYTLALASAAFLMLERLARPAGSPRRGLVLIATVFAAALVLGAVQLLLSPAHDKLHVWLGHSWSVCPFNILALSLPGLAVALWIVRGLAPTRLAAAGAAAGAFAGAVAASVYGLHCPESTATFVATWYSAGILLPAVLGAAVGPWALRW
jgi:hypothetical protein